MKGIEIPFGAKDSELCGWEYTIPEGMEAVVEGGKVIVRRKESEDERIREWLIGEIKTIYDFESPHLNPMVEKALAYLERMKEQKPSIDEIIERAKRNHEKALMATKESVERTMENYMLKESLHISETCKENPDSFTSEQQPAEWSYPYGRNETADRLVSLAECLEMDGDCRFNGYTGTDCGKFLRDLARKQVECNPAEWSEEDTEMYINVASSLRGYACGLENEEHKKHIKKGLDWLENRFKSLRPQSHWKPSEDQMRFLLAVINDPNNIGAESCYMTIKSLYNDLKKLYL